MKLTDWFPPHRRPRWVQSCRFRTIAIRLT